MLTIAHLLCRNGPLVSWVGLALLKKKCAMNLINCCSRCSREMFFFFFAGCCKYLAGLPSRCRGMAVTPPLACHGLCRGVLVALLNNNEFNAVQ